MTIHEQEAEEALRKWSSSKYAVSNVRGCKNPIGRADYNNLYLPKDWKSYWDEDGFHFPKVTEKTWWSVRSKPTLKYGHMAAYGKFPSYKDLDHNMSMWLGFEQGPNGPERIGMACFYFAARTTVNTDRVYVQVGGGGGNSGRIEVTDMLPADYTDTRYNYTVRINRGFVEFYVDNSLVAVAMEAAADNVLYENTPPYSVILTDMEMTPHQAFLIEVTQSESPGRTVDFPVDETRWTVGSPNPPRNYRLYDAGADTLLTSGTYDSGTSHKSHPIPIHGYDNKTLLFRADTDSVTDGLTVEMLTQEGNWRTYETRTPVGEQSGSNQSGGADAVSADRLRAFS